MEIVKKSIECDIRFRSISFEITTIIVDFQSSNISQKEHKRFNWSCRDLEM